MEPKWSHREAALGDARLATLLLPLLPDVEHLGPLTRAALFHAYELMAAVFLREKQKIQELMAELWEYASMLLLVLVLLVLPWKLPVQLVLVQQMLLLTLLLAPVLVLVRVVVPVLALVLVLVPALALLLALV